MGLPKSITYLNLLFDLDGTLIDSRERLYRLFQHLVPSSDLSFEEYWMLKRDRTSHQQILRSLFAYDDEKIASFLQHWLKEIESDEWLQLDKPFPGVSELIEHLRRSAKMYVVTSRQYSEGVLSQLRGYGWSNIFERILVTHQVDEKHDLIVRTLDVTEADWIIGDTGKDILAGKKLGVRTAAVLSGFLSRRRLQEYAPDLIIDTVVDLKKHL